MARTKASTGSDGDEKISVLLRVPKEVLDWYMRRAGQTLAAGTKTTHNKIMVEDLEAFFEQSNGLSKGGGK